jgi:putative hemolysin
MKNTFLILGASLGLALILSACQNPLTNISTETPGTTTPGAAETGQPVGMANPASVNCVEKGGTLEMRQNKNGEYGVCLFEDNRQCEEWALFRGDCPEGGVKITGYDNDAEIYCAITGGQVEGVGTETPMCKRIDGTYCNAQANLDSECPDPNDPNPNAGNVEAQ